MKKKKKNGATSKTAAEVSPPVERVEIVCAYVPSVLIRPLTKQQDRQETLYEKRLQRNAKNGKLNVQLLGTHFFITPPSRPNNIHCCHLCTLKAHRESFEEIAKQHSLETARKLRKNSLAGRLLASNNRNKQRTTIEMTFPADTVDTTKTLGKDGIKMTVPSFVSNPRLASAPQFAVADSIETLPLSDYVTDKSLAEKLRLNHLRKLSRVKQATENLFTETEVKHESAARSAETDFLENALAAAKLKAVRIKKTLAAKIARKNSTAKIGQRIGGDSGVVFTAASTPLPPLTTGVLSGGGEKPKPTTIRHKDRDDCADDCKCKKCKEFRRLRKAEALKAK
jgi:hypothetical protein